MPSIERLPWFALLLGIAVFLFIFTGPQIPRCLGPLNVTDVQCWAATGRRPTEGLGLPLLYATLTATALLVTGLPRPFRRAAVLACAGAAIAGGLYLAFRPTVMTGPTSWGEVISIDLPLDYSVAIAAAVAGAGIALVGMALVTRLHARRGAAKRARGRTPA